MSVGQIQMLDGLVSTHCMLNRVQGVLYRVKPILGGCLGEEE